MFQTSTRIVEPEMMDQPGLEVSVHLNALRGLSRINRLSLAARAYWPTLRAFSGAQVKGSPLRVLDLACGGGDMPIAIHERLASAGISALVHGCDISPVAVDFANTQAAGRGLDNIRFFVHDVLRYGIPAGYDVLTCSLYLHHLSRKEAVGFLRNIHASGARLVMINDLARTRFGLFLARFIPKLVSRSPIVHTDAVLSARAAFSPAQILALAEEAGLHRAQIQYRWPERYLLVWERGGA
jgi:2-polyprenyl-3-methyl-5-hydroxy-6-metoxy-1,4-benzoquinol methylase